MAKGKKLERIEIEPAENGGHTVTHRYRAELKRSKDSASGIAPEYVEPEHHVFGADQGHEMLAHVANHLGIQAGEGDADGGDGEEEAD